MGILSVSSDTVSAYKGMPGVVRMTYKDYRGGNWAVVRKQLFPTAETTFRKVSSQPVQLSATDYELNDEILPGQVFVYGNKDEFSSPLDPDQTFVVMCYREPSEPPYDFDPHRPLSVTPYGTFCEFIGVPKKISSFIRIWWDTQPNILLADRSSGVVTPDHKERIGIVKTDVPCDPGTKYYYVVQLMDELGNHNAELVQEFTTKQRRVKIEVPQIKVDNDGDPSAHGEAEFRVSIQKWAAGKNVVVGTIFKLGSDDDQQDITNGVTFPVNLAQVVGPEPGNLRVGVNAHGREFDGFLEGDELASTDPFDLWGPWWIPYRTGRDEMNDVNREEEIHVPCLMPTLEGFSFWVYVNYSVTYI